MPKPLLPASQTPDWFNAQYNNRVLVPEFAQHLARKYGVACIPVSAFYHDATDEKIVRFCFAKRDATLLEASKRLIKV